MGRRSRAERNVRRKPLVSGPWGKIRHRAAREWKGRCVRWSKALPAQFGVKRVRSGGEGIK